MAPLLGLFRVWAPFRPLWVHAGHPHALRHQTDGVTVDGAEENGPTALLDAHQQQRDTAALLAASDNVTHVLRNTAVDSIETCTARDEGPRKLDVVVAKGE